MRYLLVLPAIGLAAGLSGCGGSSSPSTTPIATPGPQTEPIGGMVVGLSGSVVLQDNGGDNLSISSNGAFTFNDTLQPNAAYAVTIVSQPAKQTCTVKNGSGTASAAVTSVIVECSLISSASDVWTWMSGSAYASAAGVYGTQGTAAAANTPSARRSPIAWTDAQGNFWLYGGDGSGNISVLSDLWEYAPSTGQWTWQGGNSVAGVPASYGTQGTAAAGNNPGGREGAAAWTDTAGNLWLFGGDSLEAQTWQDFNDLWSFSPASGLWTWVGGSSSTGNAGSYGSMGVAAAGNLPPARTNAITWTDSSGVFWLFGGAQLSSAGADAAELNDLWSFNPTSGLWTWVGGSSTPNAPGVYGTQGVAAAANVPGARAAGSAWLDASGEVWLFGGLGPNSGETAQEYSDLWQYSPGSNQWTWVAGSSGVNAAGVYGTRRASAAGDGPGARFGATAWKDTSGNLWLFGGHGYAQSAGTGELNDLWEYDIGNSVWTWISGSASTGAAGNAGVQGFAAIGNVPGAREQSAGWLDSAGNFWLFGGAGVDASGTQGDLNDLWNFAQTP